MLADRLEKLESLVSDPLQVNEKVLISRIHPAVLRSLKQNELSEAELRTVAKIIGAGFAGSEKTSTKNNCEFRFLKDLFTSSAISDHRLHALVRLLVEEPKVSLSVDEIKKIESELRGGNKSERADMLKQLQRKSKTVIRWMSSDVASLEQEVQALRVKEDTNPGLVSRLHEIILRKYAEVPDADNARSMLEMIRSYGDLDLSANSKSVNRFINIALRRSIAHDDAHTARELWHLKKEFSPETCLSYALFLIARHNETQAAVVLAEVNKTPDDHAFMRAMQQPGVSAAALERFVDLVVRTFAVNHLTHKRLVLVIKTMELRSAIAVGDLNKAYDVAKATSELQSLAFGQNDLMAACIQAEDLAMLQRVFKLVVKQHDPNTAFIDMTVAFLECGGVHRAEKLVRKAGNLYISTAKMEFLNNRETELQKPEVLHKLFLLVHDRACADDVMVSLERCINMYAHGANLVGLKELQTDLNKINFAVDRKLKAHLEACIVKVTHELAKLRTKKSDSSTSVHSPSSHGSTSDSHDVSEVHDKPRSTASAMG